MQFKVPQFLDIEDKIFGPFTFSQFAYLLGGGGIAFFLYKLLGLSLGLIPILFIISLALALTFYRPNNKPFSDMLESAILYFAQDKLYIWKRRKEKKPIINQEKKEEKIIHNPRLNRSRLRDLSWSLDVLDLRKTPHSTENDTYLGNNNNN